MFIPNAPRTADDVGEVWVPETPQFRPVTQGIGAEWYPVQAAGALWQCPYGCPGVRHVAADLEAHTWDCPYWTREGIEQTPF